MRTNQSQTSCGDCGKKATLDVFHNSAGITICAKCNEKYISCAGTGLVTLKSEAAEWNGVWYSVGALSNLTFICHGNGQRYANSYSWSWTNPETSETNEYSEEYRNSHFTNCNFGGYAETPYANEGGYTYATRQAYLEYRQVEGCVKAWNYQPHYQWIFNHKRGDTRRDCIGVELEVILSTEDLYSSEINQASNDVQDILGDSFYLKSDSSIQEAGFEIVSMPLGYKHITKEVNIYNTLDSLKEVVSSHHSCGLHIHVCKSMICHNNTNIRNLNWWKVSKFLAKLRKTMIGFAGRTEANISDWARIGTPRRVENRMKEHYTGGKRYPFANVYGRYSALNNSDKGTMEFRLFASTLDYNELMSRIQFVFAVIDFAKNHGYSFFELSPPTKLLEEFKSFTKQQNKYHILVKEIEKPAYADLVLSEAS